MTLDVGLIEDSTTGNTEGHLRLDESKLTITGATRLGPGSTFKTVVRGINAGEFGSIETGTAALDGNLVVEVHNLFNGQGTIDLIVSGSADGIVGDFASVSAVGLPPGRQLATSIVLDGGVERYRLTLDVPIRAPTSVPVPILNVWSLLLMIGMLVFTARSKL